MHAEQAKGRRSRRTGLLPRGVYNAQREMTDPAYSESMQATRKQLANELYPQGSRNCVAKLRLERGMSQQQLADSAGLTQPHLAKIEAGKLSVHLKTAVQLADALQVGLDSLRELVPVVEHGPTLSVHVATL